MLDVDSTISYKLAAANFPHREGFDLFHYQPVAFIGNEQAQQIVLSLIDDLGNERYQIGQLDSNGQLDRGMFTFDRDNEDFYYAFKPHSKVGNTYLCICTQTDKQSGKLVSQSNCAISIASGEYGHLDICYFDQHLQPINLLAPDIVALKNGGLVSLPGFNLGDEKITNLEEVFGLDVDPDLFNFHAVKLDKSRTAVISLCEKELGIDRREFIRVKVGESPLHLERFYPIETELDPNLVGSEGEIFWGTLGENQFCPTLWDKSGIAQPLAVPKQYSDILPKLLGISKSAKPYGVDRLFAYFDDGEFCIPIAWNIEPSQIGEIPRVNASEIVLEDGGAIRAIHDVSAKSGLMIATILPFGSSTLKRCVLAPEIKL